MPTDLGIGPYRVWVSNWHGGPGIPLNSSRSGSNRRLSGAACPTGSWPRMVV